MLAARLLLAALPAAGVAAQQYVNPAEFRAVEGNTSLSHGFGSGANQSRFLEINQSNPALIHALSFRRDGGATETFPAVAIVADIYCSHARKGFQRIESEFDNNHGLIKIKVASAKVFSFPETAPGTIPNPFVYRFPFDVPFGYDGTNPLCWEIVTHYRTSSQPFHLDAMSGWNQNPPPEVWVGGTGCLATGRTGPATLDARSDPNWSNKPAQTPSTVDLIYDGSSFPAGASVFMAFGGSDKAWGGTMLPFVLPGTANAPSGPCTIYTDYTLVAPVVADAQGAFSATYTAAMKMVPAGTNIFAQAIALDPGANPYGLVFSNLAQFNVVLPSSFFTNIAHVYLNGSLGANGTVQHWSGLIVQID
jgi:hypothetical protein